MPGRYGASGAASSVAAHPRTPVPAVTTACAPSLYADARVVRMSAAVIMPTPGPAAPAVAAISARCACGSRRV
ncbi:hypothetical protein GCM10010361_37660 [Streptomyces olivaceiscleroticus]|uniref:Uncharacterized protein n=1 Tax=Streptomyces olivaceiscleroticus TaxID=68245 RepID=A0ABP3K506_9ACTN